MKVNWFEFKYLDTSTNRSSQTEIIKSFKEKGFEIEYHCSYKNKKKYFGLSINDINYIDTPKIRFVRGMFILSVIFWRSLLAYVKKTKNVQIIDYTSVYACIPVLLLNKLLKRQVFILDIRTYPVDKTYSRLPISFRIPYNISCIFCDGISYITEVMREDAANWSSLSPNTCTTWGSGYNPEIFKTNQVRNKNDKTLKLIYHGGLSISRGILNLIKAIEICVSKGENIHLTLIGVWVDKPELISYVRNNNLDPYIDCLDPVDIERIPPLINSADIGILPFPDFIGWKVSSPIKLFEYLGMGKPVIITEIDCFTKEIGYKNFTVYAKNATPVELAAAISKTIENRTSLISKGTEAIQFARNNYTWNAQANKLINLLESLCP